MFFPIGDDDRRLEGTAWITLLLIGSNLIVFFLLQQAGGNSDFTYGWSVIPKELTTGTDLTANQTITVDGKERTLPQAPGPTPIYLTVLSSMFMHGGYLHLFGNLLYLWIFGDNVEHRFGGLPFLALYLGAGIAGTAVQVFLVPDGVIANLGASGAISGVLGAYFLLFPRNRVRVILFYFIVSVPAVIVIGMWIAFQFFNGLGAVTATQETAGGVAYGAHVGGFFAGLAGALVLRGLISEPDSLRDDRRRGRR
jgi:membrane associated rhomboid family serine protease